MNDDEFRDFMFETIDKTNYLIQDCCVPRLDANAMNYLFKRFNEVRKR